MKRMDEKMRLLMTCCATSDEAAKLARLLVVEKLAACVNILPAQSVYSWKEELVEEKEQLLLIKTRASLSALVQKRIKELHSYELPEIVYLSPTEVESSYLAWVMKETGS